MCRRRRRKWRGQTAEAWMLRLMESVCEVVVTKRMLSGGMWFGVSFMRSVGDSKGQWPDSAWPEHNGVSSGSCRMRDGSR